MRFSAPLFLLLLVACGNQAENNADRKPDVIIRLADNDARGLDPHIVSDLASLRIASDQFEGLTRFNMAGEAEAGLAKSWTTSNNGKIWRFTLRDALKFSDGTPITAKVFQQNLERIRNPKTASAHQSLFNVIDAINVVSKNEVQIVLKHPFPQLPSLLAHPAMAALPFHAINKMGDKWTSQRPLVTSGAYRLKEWKLAQHSMLERNPYWHEGKSATAEIIWRPSENAQSGLKQILSGGADTSSDFPTSRLRSLQEEHPEILQIGDYLGSYYFVFNTRKAPFDNKDIRKALSMAVDREWIADKMIAAGNKAAWGVIPPALSAQDNYKPEWAKMPREHRIKQARLLLAKHGYNAQNPLSFEIRFNSSSQHRRAAVAMSAMWRDIGVDAKLLNTEASLHFDALRRGDFQLARSGWIADFPAAENFLAIHRSDAGTQNYSGYSNPDYDTAFDEAGAISDPNLRLAAMQKAEQILMADYAILPLYFYVSRNLVQSDIKGWMNNPSNIHPSRYLYRGKK